MAFQAGTINVGGFLACHRFVTHVTGFATHIGVETSLGNIPAALGMLTVPFFFVAGSMLSGYLVDHRIAQHKSPMYLTGVSLMFCLLASAVYLGSNNQFGVFGAPMLLEADYSLLAILCLTSGIQNAMITSASGSVVRTTHITGVSTDLGIGIIRVLARPRGDHLRNREFLANMMRVGIIGSFILGSIIGGLIFVRLKYLGFLLPLTITGGFLLLGWWRKSNG